MKSTHLALMLAFLTTPAWAVCSTDEDDPMKVLFVSPENYSDIEPRYLIADLRTYLQQHAAKYLSPGQRLTITISDIDMAGGFKY